MISEPSSDSSSSEDYDLLKADLERLFAKRGLPVEPLDRIEPRDPSTRRPAPPLELGDMDPEEPQASTSGSGGSAPETARGQRGERVCPYVRFFESKAAIANFRGTYEIPEGVKVELGPTSLEGLPEAYAEGKLVVPLMAIVEGGVRFPLHPFLRRVLNALNLTTTQISINSYRVVMSVVALREEFPDLRFGINELFEAFYVGWNKTTDVRYLASRPKYTELLIEKIPEKDEWGSVFVVVSGPSVHGPDVRKPVRWDEGVFDIGAVGSLRTPHNPDVIAAAYALPAHLREAPRLLGYHPSYRVFLKKKKKKGAPASSSQPSNPPQPSSELGDMAPKRAPVDLTARSSKAARGKGPVLGGPEQSARRAPISTAPKDKRSRDEPSEPAEGQRRKKGRNGSPREEEVSQERAGGSSQGPSDPHAWAPQVVTDAGRQVNAGDAGLANSGVAVALCRAIALPRDKRAVADEGSSLFARQCQDVYRVMVRGLVFERQHEDDLAKIGGLKERLKEVGGERNAAKAELAEKALALESRELEYATKASALEASEREVAKLKTLLEAAEDKYYNQGYDEAEAEYKRQVEVVRHLEFAEGARQGFACAHKELFAQRGIDASSVDFVLPEPLPEFLVRESTPPSSPYQPEPSETPAFPPTEAPPTQPSPPQE